MANTELKWHIMLYHNFFVYLPVFILIGLISLVYVGFISTYVSILLYAESYTDEDFPFIDTISRESAYDKGVFLLWSVNIFFVLLLGSMLRTIFMDPGYFDSPFSLEHKIILAQCIQKEHNKLPDAGRQTKAFKYQDKDVDQTYSNEHISPECRLKEYDLDSNANTDLNESVNLAEKRKILDIDLYNTDDRIEFLNDFNHIASSAPLTQFENQVLNEKLVDYLSPEGSHPRIQIIQKKDSDTATFSPEVSPSNACLNTDTDENLFNTEDHFKRIELNKAMLCGTCLRFKFERSHHCRQCGKCVLKMDHHCPWLANCIGFRNYKYFLLIELHGIIASLIIIFSYWEAVIGYNTRLESSLIICWFVGFCYFCSFGLFFFLVWLMIINWKLAFTGQTVIENSDRERFPLNKNVNIYDLGLFKNFKAVFGSNPLLWFLPFGANYNGNGLVFETIYNSVNTNIQPTQV